MQCHKPTLQLTGVLTCLAHFGAVTMAKKPQTATTAPAGISKVDALRQAMKAVGAKAKNQELADWIKSKYGTEAVPSNISVTKSSLKKTKRKKAGKTRAARRLAPARNGAADPIVIIKAAQQLIAASGGVTKAREVLTAMQAASSR